LYRSNEEPEGLIELLEVDERVSVSGTPAATPKWN
jgi:hypothetical protein